MNRNMFVVHSSDGKGKRRDVAGLPRGDGPDGACVGGKIDPGVGDLGHPGRASEQPVATDEARVRTAKAVARGGSGRGGQAMRAEANT